MRKLILLSILIVTLLASNQNIGVLKLQKGWNLISTPTIEDINSSIFESVWGYQNDEWIKPKYLKAKNGYFVKLRENLNYEYNGSSYRVNLSTKDNSWYLFGSGEKILNIDRNYIKYIYRDGVWILNPSEIEIGEGFWIKRDEVFVKEEFIKFLNKNRNGVKTDKPIDSITSNDLENITKIYFSSRNIKTLPAEIGLLTNLKELVLSENNLETLPSELFKLKNLEYLDLESNNLTSFSGDEFSNLENLKGLELSKNRLTTFPSPLKAFSNLISLFINENNISTIPKEIGGLESLEHFQINRNQLTNIDDGIGELKNLISLDLGDNNLTTLPKGIGGLEKVKFIDLIRNKLTSLSSEIGDLDSLEDFMLVENNLTYLPKEIGDMENLRYLTLLGNQITKLPEEIGNAPILERIDLDNNPIVELPLSLINLEILILSLNNTPFSQGIVKIPDEIKESARKIYLSN